MLDKLGSSVAVMVLGLLIVFIGLTILIFFTWLMGKVIGGIDKKQEPRTKAAEPVQAVKADAAKLVNNAPHVESGISPEIVAVIAAAVAAMSGSDQKLVIRSIQRRKPASVWADAARREQMVF